jgi:hypothetical protein
MEPNTGDSEPAADVRASDAERDATVERLSAATGDGRLTLDEFSQRMERASSARTRAELDRLVADAIGRRGGGNRFTRQVVPGQQRRRAVSARV